MHKPKVTTWSQMIPDIVEDINGKIIVSDERWNALLEVSGSALTCKEALYWLETQPNAKWSTAFYEKMKQLADSSFLHQRWLAEQALKQKDQETAISALEQMIERAKENSAVTWWSHILRLLPEDDPRIPMCIAQKKLTSEKNKNFRP